MVHVHNVRRELIEKPPQFGIDAVLSIPVSRHSIVHHSQLDASIGRVSLVDSCKLRQERIFLASEDARLIPISQTTSQCLGVDLRPSVVPGGIAVNDE